MKDLYEQLNEVPSKEEYLDILDRIEADEHFEKTMRGYERSANPNQKRHFARILEGVYGMGDIIHGYDDGARLQVIN